MISIAYLHFLYRRNKHVGMSQYLIARAYRAFLSSDGLTGLQPDGTSTLETINGLVYIALRNGGTVLAVYRFMNHHRLRRLRRPPASLMGRTCAPAAASKQSHRNEESHAV